MSAKLIRLQPFKAPPPNPKQACVACEAFEPTCLVPDGDGALPLCWLCAHHVVEHGASLGHAPCAECECTAQEIYPNRVFDNTAPKLPERSPRELEREKLLGMPVEKLAGWAREAHKQMSAAQLAAVKKRLS